MANRKIHIDKNKYFFKRWYIRCETALPPCVPSPPPPPPPCPTPVLMQGFHPPHSLQPPLLLGMAGAGSAGAVHSGFAQQSRARAQHLIQFVLPRLKYEMVASQNVQRTGKEGESACWNLNFNENDFNPSVRPGGNGTGARVLGMKPPRLCLPVPSHSASGSC